MENFLNRLARNPYAPIDAASITRVDELGNGYDDFGQLIAPKFQQPQQTWGETALGVATAPARMATALAGSLSPYGQDGWQVPPIVSEGVDALTAVGDAYSGKMAPEEIPGRALGMAGFMMGGGGAAMALERSLPQASVNLGDRAMAKYLDWKHPDAQSTPAPDMPSSKLAWRYGADLNTNDVLQRYSPLETRAGELFGEPELPNLNGYQAELLNKLSSDDAHYADLNRRSMETYGVGYEGLTRDQTRHIRDGIEPPKPRPTFDVIDGGLYSNSSKEGAIPALLDMGQEARLARAREMGFDTSRTLYHGTDRDFESFNPSQSGAYGPGVYVTPDADYANRYAIGRSGWEQDTRIMPLHVRGELADGMLYEALKREVRATGVPEEQIGQAVQQQLRDMGYAGVEGRANQAVAVFDPANIRSTNAAFDPSQSNSTNLLAANADSRPALLAGIGQEHDIPGWLLPYLGR